MRIPIVTHRVPYPNVSGALLHTFGRLKRIARELEDWFAAFMETSYQVEDSVRAEDASARGIYHRLRELCAHRTDLCGMGRAAGDLSTDLSWKAAAQKLEMCLQNAAGREIRSADLQRSF